MLNDVQAERMIEIFIQTTIESVKPYKCAKLTGSGKIQTKSDFLV